MALDSVLYPLLWWAFTEKWAYDSLRLTHKLWPIANRYFWKLHTDRFHDRWSQYCWKGLNQCNSKKSDEINNWKTIFCFDFIFTNLETHKSLQTIRKKRIIFSSSTKRRSSSSIRTKGTVSPCRRVSWSVYIVTGPHRSSAQRNFKLLSSKWLPH